MIPVHAGTLERCHSAAMERLHDQLIHELMQTFEEKLSAAAEADGNAKHNIKLRRDDGGAVVLVTSAWPAASPYFWGGGGYCGLTMRLHW